MSTSPSLSQFKALVFDCYGTLIDWESGIYTALQPLLSTSNRHWTRKDALTAFVSVELDIQARSPRTLYADVLAGTYDALARRLHGSSEESTAPTDSDSAPAVVVSSAPGVEAHTVQAGTSSSSNEEEKQYSEEAKRFAASVKDWPAFEDTIDALGRLKGLGLKLVILSNVDRASFEGTRRVLEHGFEFDGVYTAEEIGSYKPNPANHRFVLDALQTPKEEVLAVAQSLVHDHVPAKALGLRSVWIDRAGAVVGLDGDGVPVDRAGKEAFASWRFETMGQFADAYEAALSGH